jgi:hypothetical protein
MNKSKWNNEAVKAYESGQGVVLVEKPYPHYEPVAWNAGIPSLHPKMKEGETISVEYLELTPPQRTWVGLTEAECGVLWKVDMTPFDYYQAIEAKLRSKNT